MSLGLCEIWVDTAETPPESDSGYQTLMAKFANARKSIQLLFFFFSLLTVTAFDPPLGFQKQEGGSQVLLMAYLECHLTWVTTVWHPAV